MRLVTSAARGRLRVPGIADIAEKFTDSARLKDSGFVFEHGASGPWGEDVGGGWMNFERARTLYLEKRRSHFSEERPLFSFWYDWHATL